MPLPQEKHYTLADALTWDESERIELIYGDPFMMAPPVRKHQEALMELSAQLHAYLKGKKCKVYPAPFVVRLFELIRPASRYRSLFWRKAAMSQRTSVRSRTW